MSTYDSEKSEHRDAKLASALRDVKIPEGLEQRLLAAVSEDAGEVKSESERLASVGAATNDGREGTVPAGVSRRRVLEVGLAAGVSGLLAGTGTYLWRTRPIARNRVFDEVAASVLAKNWFRWGPMNSFTGGGIPVQLRRPGGWQARELSFASSATAFEMTTPGGPPAILFVLQTSRSLPTSEFPLQPPAKPQRMASKQWSLFAAWQGGDGHHLYVLAMGGGNRDYQRLFPSGSTPVVA